MSLQCCNFLFCGASRLCHPGAAGLCVNGAERCLFNAVFRLSIFRIKSHLPGAELYPIGTGSVISVLGWPFELGCMLLELVHVFQALNRIVLVLG